MSAGFDRFFDVLRWIAVPPVAVAAAFLGYYGAWIAIWMTLVWAHLDPEGLHGQLILHAAARATMGFMFVVAGFIVAPKLQKQTAYVLAAIGLMWSGYALTVALLTEVYFNIWPSLWLAAGVGMTAYEISEGAEPGWRQG